MITKKWILLAALILLILLFLSAGVGEKEVGLEERQIEEHVLKEYEGTFLRLQEIPKALVTALSEAEKGTEIVFNGYRVEVLSVRIEDAIDIGGVRYKASIGVLESGGGTKPRFVETRRGKVGLIILKFTRVAERGFDPPVLTVRSPLLSLIFFGGIPAEKELVLTSLSPRILLEDGTVVAPRRLIVDRTRPHCTFDTLSGANSAEGACIFVLPAEPGVKEILVSAFPSEREGRLFRAALRGLGYPILRVTYEG